ncbi:MAG: hypothetical protein HP052_01175 [Firmicutes bacterium]|nr:hypothetical protein [Bacillota bacterium]
MIWSIIPESVIFNGADDSEELHQVDYLGRKLLVRFSDNRSAQIVSLLSTDPADFLSPRFSPGAQIDIR